MTNITVESIAKYIEEIKDKIDPREFNNAIMDIAEIYNLSVKEYTELKSLLE